MKSDLAFDLVTAGALAFVFCGLALSSCMSGVRVGRDMILDPERTAVENDNCALRGLVLLRGQQGEFVCVTPGSEKYRRKP